MITWCDKGHRRRHHLYRLRLWHTIHLTDLTLPTLPTPRAHAYQVATLNTLKNPKPVAWEANLPKFIHPSIPIPLSQSAATFQIFSLISSKGTDRNRWTLFRVGRSHIQPRMRTRPQIGLWVERSWPRHIRTRCRMVWMTRSTLSLFMIAKRRVSGWSMREGTKYSPWTRQQPGYCVRECGHTKSGAVWFDLFWIFSGT